jgi:hypothetical protein
MGASVSTSNQSTSTVDVLQNAEKCPKVASQQNINVGDLSINTPANCPPGQVVNVGQSLSISAECALDSAINLTTNLVSTAQNSSTAGLGVAAAVTNADVKSQLQTSIDQQCSNVSSQQTMQFNKIEINTCANVNITQGYNANVDCKLKALQEAATTAQNVATTSATGASLSSLLGSGMILYLIVGVVAAGALYFVYTKYMESQGKKPQGFGGLFGQAQAQGHAQGHAQGKSFMPEFPTKGDPTNFMKKGIQSLQKNFKKGGGSNEAEQEMKIYFALFLIVIAGGYQARK